VDGWMNVMSMSLMNQSTYRSQQSTLSTTCYHGNWHQVAWF